MPKRRAQGEPSELERGLLVYELKEGEKMARITINVAGADLACLVQGCGFRINVPSASRAVMERELKDFYKDHRKHRHPEYAGRTLYEFALGDDVPRTALDEVPF